MTYDGSKFRQGNAEDSTGHPDSAAPGSSERAEDATADVDAAVGEGDASSPENPLAGLIRERDELRDRLMRAQAECSNIAKRLSQQHAHERRHAGMTLAKSMLPILDGLERTLINMRESGKEDAIFEGVQLLKDECIKAFRQHGIEPIESVGHPFDPEYHEALLQDVHSDKPAGTVTMEYERGYTFHDRILRHAKVVVSAPGDRDGDRTQENVASGADGHTK